MAWFRFEPLAANYVERLKRRAPDVELHLIDGGHKMPSSGGAIVVPWLRRILT